MMPINPLSSLISKKLAKLICTTSLASFGGKIDDSSVDDMFSIASSSQLIVPFGDPPFKLRITTCSSSLYIIMGKKILVSFVNTYTM
jgi:hypothetical protein